MTAEGQVWQLVRDEELIAEIVVDGGDFPWLHGRVVPAPAFSQVKLLFDRELELLDAEDHQAWESTYDQIDGVMTLVSPDGPVAEFLLHIKDDRAWFRWSNKPFAKTTGHTPAAPDVATADDR